MRHFFHDVVILRRPYATGPSPIYHGSGSIPGKDFWIFGLLLGVLFFGVYITVGVPWMGWLGI